MAAGALTAQAASSGRLAHQPSVEGRWGMKWERPVKHMSEYLAILDSLFETGTAEQMLKMADKRTDGTILWCVGPKTLEQQIVPIINDAAAGAGRSTPRVVCSLPVCVTDDPQPTTEFVGKMLEGYATLPSYRAMLDIEGVHGVEEISLIGNEDTVNAGLDAIAAAGATDFTAVVIPDRDGPTRTMDLLQARA